MPPPANQAQIIAQTLVNGRFDEFPTVIVKEKDLTAERLSVFDQAQPLGLSPGYAPSGALVALAIADDKNCLLVEFASGKSSTNVNPESTWGKARQLLQDKVLCRDAGELFAFDFHRISSALYYYHRLRITNAVDIASAVDLKYRDSPLDVITAILGSETQLIKPNIKTKFKGLTYDIEERNRVAAPAERAWISQYLVTEGNGREVMDRVNRINTKDMNDEFLSQLAKIGADSHRLDHLKPTETQHRLDTSRVMGDGIEATPSAYKEKFRKGQDLRITMTGPRGEMRIKGSVAQVSGKRATVNPDRNLNAEVATVISVGRDAPTLAEGYRDDAILRALQGNTGLVSNPWFQNIFMVNSPDNLRWPEDWTQTPKSKNPLPAASPNPTKASSHDSPKDDKPHTELNNSQRDAVEAIMSKDDSKRLILVHGPPGTGKTSVIAAYVTSAVEQGEKGIWLIAQSNVAVKNIAEKLIKVGFKGWKLLVSDDFHFQWHEHIYAENIQKHKITSKQFKFVKSKDLKDCSVILCTLSMLSNSSISKFAFNVPLSNLIVDEASQIQVGDYIPVFQMFSSLRKMVFIGDDKQLPPYGQEDINDLKSIFELKHLSEQFKYFLDIQYRMPPQIGSFISKHVYNNKLNSNPGHLVKDDTIACYFIDINGKEQREGNGWKNEEECNAVIKIGQYFQELESDLANYKFITPYDGQRNVVEREMKNTEGFKWEGKCFNVDSFQGNEEEYIIISLVRSRELGFLKKIRRTNVMLTRFKKGMIILSSRKFLFGPAKSSLVGKLAAYVSEEAWLKPEDLEKGLIEKKLKF